MSGKVSFTCTLPLGTCTPCNSKRNLRSLLSNHNYNYNYSYNYSYNYNYNYYRVPTPTSRNSIPVLTSTCIVTF